MTLRETLRVAVYALLRNKLRSFLTMLGIVIGVGCVIAVVAIGNGATKSVEATINSLGTNYIMIFPGASTQSGARIFTTLLHAMRGRNAKRGLATLCIGGGEAVAVIAERV